MNKPNTKDLRLLANEYFDGQFDSQDVKNILTQCADFIDSLEGKHICEWPKEATKEYLLELSDRCEKEWFMRSSIILHAFAAIAPEAPKKRKVEIWQYKDKMPELCYYPPFDPEGCKGWRKVGECEIDE